MNCEMQIIYEVGLQADKHYDEAVRLGNHAAIALQARHRSQLTGLENIADSSFKTSDIFDFIKKQTARFQHWRLPDRTYQNPQQAFGERLKDYLEFELKKNVKSICEGSLGIGDEIDADKQERRRIHLMLMRQFIRQMVAQYEYRVSLDNNRR